MTLQHQQENITQQHVGGLLAPRVECGLCGSHLPVVRSNVKDSANKCQVFKVVMQPDTIGNRLKEVQEKAQDLAHFGASPLDCNPCWNQSY